MLFIPSLAGLLRFTILMRFEEVAHGTKIDQRMLNN
jgi:hypothetical protein